MIMNEWDVPMTASPPVRAVLVSREPFSTTRQVLGTRMFPVASPFLLNRASRSS